MIQESHAGNVLSVELFKLLGRTPISREDVYKKLPMSSRRQWAHYSMLNSQQVLEAIQRQRIKWHVHVKLLGFSGEGNMQLVLSEVDVAQYLKSIKTENRLVELDTERYLGISGEFQFSVTKVARHVTSEVEGAIKGALNANSDADSGLQLIDYKVVDRVLKREQRQQSGMFTIFVLNPKYPGLDYSYRYNNSPEGCPGNFWVDGNSSYMWVDLSAAPVTYGPSAAGEGKVLPHAFPRLSNYRQTVAKLGLLADIANMVQSAAKQMIASPLKHLPQQHPLGQIVIKIVHLHDTPNWMASELPNLNTQLIKSQLTSLLFPEQKLQIVNAYLNLGACDVCVAAYTRSLRMRTRRDQLADGPSIAIPSLESSELLYWMKQYQDRILAAAGLGHEKADNYNTPTTVLPVFLFHVMYDHVLLMDGKYQALGHQGIVVGVVSRGGETITEFSCMEHVTLLQPSNMTRVVLSQILQEGWGIPAPELTWSDSNGQRYDYKWTVGNNPFGFLSMAATIPFYQRMGAQRNLLLALRNYTIYQVGPLLEGFQGVADQNNQHPTTREFLVELRARQHLLLFKLQHAMQLIGHQQLHLSLQLLLSVQQDANALRQIALETYRNSDARVKCFEKDNFGNVLLASILGLFGIAIFILLGVVIVVLLRAGKVVKRRRKKAL